jgi:hypothetical protein
LFVVTVWDWPVAAAVTVTVALATVACCGSRTVPTMRPVCTCVQAGAARVTARSVSVALRTMSLLPSGNWNARKVES